MSLLEDERKAAERLRTVANERAKLTAGYVNTIAGSVFGIGGLAPIFAVLYAPSTPSIPIGVIIGISLVCSIASGALRYVGRRYLGELQ